jgi:cell division protein FtsQ
VAARRRATARAAVLPARRGAPSLTRFVPSARSVAAGVAIFAAAAGAYAGARETSVFAVRTLDVRGGSPRVQAQVRAALRPELGRSLVRVDGDELERRLAAVPDVLAMRYDRAFPNTLRVVVTPERPVLLLRRHKSAWVVSARGRVLRRIDRPRLSSLPRVWVPGAAKVEVGKRLAPGDGGLAAVALAPLAGGRFPGGVHMVRAGPKELTLVLWSGVEVRLGGVGDLRLKYTIARHILRALGDAAAGQYVDVSVPERPVVGPLNPQVGG